MLTRKEQIKVLKRVKEKLIRDHKHERIMIRGLCGYVEEEIKNITGEYCIPYYYLKKYIPLFTQENAEKHANANITDQNYWWKHSSVPHDYDLVNRVLFLDWMIGKLRWKFFETLRKVFTFNK